MDTKKFFVILLCAFAFFSLMVNFALVYIIIRDQQVFQQNQINQRVLNFRNMFTEYVLLSGKEIDFDTRLAMETAVRNLDDPEIFTQWQKFTNSQTKEEATAEAKELLSLLIEKTSQ